MVFVLLKKWREGFQLIDQ